MNVTTKLKSKAGKKPGSPSSKEVLSLTFENNQLATQLFGQFDEHLAMFEKMLGIEAVARGNEVVLSGDETTIQQGRMALEHLYSRLEQGETLEKGDVTGAVRMAQADDQLSLPSIAEKP